MSNENRDGAKEKVLKDPSRDMPMRSDTDREHGSTPERFKIRRFIMCL